MGKAASDSEWNQDHWTPPQRAGLVCIGGLLIGLVAIASSYHPRERQFARYANARLAPKVGLSVDGVAAGTPVVVVEDPGPVARPRRVMVTVEVGPKAGNLIGVPREDLLPR